MWTMCWLLPALATSILLPPPTYSGKVFSHCWHILSAITPQAHWDITSVDQGTPAPRANHYSPCVLGLRQHSQALLLSRLAEWVVRGRIRNRGPFHLPLLHQSLEFFLPCTGFCSVPSHPSHFHPLHLNSSPNFLSSRLMSSHVHPLSHKAWIHLCHPSLGLCKHGVVQGWGLSLHLMVLLAILYKPMAGHKLQLVFRVPKFQLFPTLAIPRRFLHASWDSESCSYCSLSLEPFFLLPWSRSLDRVEGVSQGFIIWS